MAKKVGLEKFAAELEKIVAKYGEDIQEHSKEVVRTVARKGVQAVAQEADAKGIGHGRYSAGWKAQIEQDRMVASATLYNVRPGLPHLLEHGHMLRNGRRSTGKPHAGPAEQMINEFFERTMRDTINDI